MRTRHTGTLFLLALAVQIGLKLWLVHHHEVVACDYPFDDPWYVVASTNWYWWGSYAEGAFIRSPAYPLWIALSRSAGLPLRLSTEFLFLAAAGAFILSLVRAGLPRTAATVVFGLIVFHPFSVYVNDAVMSESLYAPILLASIAGMIVLLTQRANRRVAVWTGLALGVLWHTRQETPLIVFQIGLFAVVAAWVGAGEGKTAREIARGVGVMVLIVSTVGAGVSLAVRTMNYASFGAFADRQGEMPGFLAAQGALLRITPEQRMRWVGVPRESLQRAYAVSPTLRLLQPYFDGPEGRMWEASSPQTVAQAHEIAGRFGWPLRAAILWAGYGNSAADTEAFCHRIAEEIDAACTTGKLRCTHARLGSLVLVRSGLSQVPFSFASVASLLFWRATAVPPRCPATFIRPPIVDVFDFAANRRTALVTAVLHIAGWAVDFVDPVQTISFQDAEGRVIAFTDRLRARPDLDAAFRARLAPQSGPLLAAFDLRISFPRDQVAGGALMFALRSGKTVEVPYDQLRSVALKHPSSVGDDRSLEYAIEYRHVQGGSGLEDRALSALLRWYGNGVVALSVAGLASLLILLPARMRGASARRLYGVVVLLLGLTVSRVTLLALFDASVWPGDDPRYLYPVAYLYPCAVLVLLWCAGRGVMAGISQKLRKP